MEGRMGATPRVNAATRAALKLAASSFATEEKLMTATSAPGVDPNAIGPDGHGWTMLHQASLCGCTEWARLLLRIGADIDPKSQVQETPLHVACCHNRVGVIELLLRAGANVRTIDWRGHDLWTSLRAKADMRNPVQVAAAVALVDKYAQQSLSTAQKDSEILRKQGNAAFAEGDFDRALELYDAANAIKPTAQACANAALIHLRRSQWRESLRASRKAKQLDPLYGKGWYRDVQVYVALRDFAIAHKQLVEAVGAVAADDKTLPRLQRMLAVLDECGVTACWSPCDVPTLQALTKKVDRGAAHKRCTYCRQALTLPLRKWQGKCPWCACDPCDPRGAKIAGKLAKL